MESRFLGNFSYKIIQMLREIILKLFRKLLRKSKLKSIIIDIDSSVVNVEGNQDGTVKGSNPKKPENPRYNLRLAFCDDIKAYLTGYVRIRDTYTANGTAGMIKEIVAQLKDEGLEITFRMDSCYSDDAILETIESLGSRYVIKAKGYPTLGEQLTDPSIVFVTSAASPKTTELVTAFITWEKGRIFVVSQVLKDKKDRGRISLLEGEAYDHFFVTNTEQSSEKVVDSMKIAGTVKIIIRKSSMIWGLDTCYSSHLGHMK